MKRIIVNAIMIFICFILQTAVFGSFKLADVMPNIFFIIISSMAMLRGQKEGMLVGFFCGIMVDLLYGPYLGMYALIYMILGFLAGYFHRVYFADDILMPGLIIGITDFVYGLTMYVIYGLLQNHLHVLTYFVKIILPEAVYTAAIGIVFYRIFFRVNRWLEKGEKGRIDFD